MKLKIIIQYKNEIQNENYKEEREYTIKLFDNEESNENNKLIYFHNVIYMIKEFDKKFVFGFFDSLKHLVDNESYLVNKESYLVNNERINTDKIFLKLYCNTINDLLNSIYDTDIKYLTIETIYF